MDAAVVVPLVLAIAVGYLLLPSILMVMTGARRARPVTCPDNSELVEIRLDPKREARRLFTDCRASVCGCSRWPAKAGCDQACTG